MVRIKEGFKGERAIVVPKMITDALERDPMGSALQITDIGFYPAARHHFRERREPISQWVLIYCVEGRGWYTLGTTRHEVEAGQCFILPAQLPHAYGADAEAPWTIYWVHFKGTLAQHYAEGMAVPQTIPISADSRIGHRQELFEEIFYTIKQGYGRENMHYAISLFHHFLGTLRYLRLYRSAGAQSNTQGDDAASRAIHYMKENLGCHLTLEQVAQYAGYAPTYFARLFREQVGHPPLAYFNVLKMQAACQMLDTTDMKITQISGKLGIDDPYYFSRLFTKIIGISPTQYRTTAKG
ncbi:MAG: AraC family transcriptional regulator [Bacteroidales bacterium]|nr:AraC family transcriptional regulator [Bacteroidales bacterium]